MKRFTLSLLCSILSIAASFAQDPPVSVGYSYDVRTMIAFNGKIFFGGVNELWCTDGTDQGTAQVKALGGHVGFPTSFKIFNNRLFFVATDSLHGYELWSTDGTTAGTAMVKDINPYDTKSAFSLLFNVHYSNTFQELNGKLYFIADDSVHGRELWMTDGTSAGTQMVKDIYSVADSNGVPAPASMYNNAEFVLAGNKIYFPANDGNGAGTELWATDGTAAGTQMVTDIFPGATSGKPRNLMPFQNKLVFTSDDNTSYTTSIYISDGTSSGTTGIGFGYLNTSDHAILNNKLYFFAKSATSNDYYLCESDGTEPGTIPVVTFANMISYPAADFGKGNYGLTEYNGKLYFRGVGQSSSGSEPWISDGTAGGTMLLKDMNPNNNKATLPYSFTPFGNKLFFRTDDSVWLKLNYTDGTTAGTHELVMPGADYSISLFTIRRYYQGAPLIQLGNCLYFMNPYFTSAGVKIYRLGMFPTDVNGTPQITSIDVYPNPTEGFINVNVHDATNISVHDMTGKLVYNKTVSPTDNIHRIETQHMPPGTYSITTILKDGSKRSGKFVKQ